MRTSCPRSRSASGSARATSASPPVFQNGTASEVAKRILTRSVTSGRHGPVAAHALFQDQFAAIRDLISDRVVQKDPVRRTLLVRVPEPPAPFLLRGEDRKSVV